MVSSVTKGSKGFMGGFHGGIAVVPVVVVMVYVTGPPVFVFSTHGPLLSYVKPISRLLAKLLEDRQKNLRRFLQLDLGSLLALRDEVTTELTALLEESLFPAVIGLKRLSGARPLQLLPEFLNAPFLLPQLVDPVFESVFIHSSAQHHSVTKGEKVST